MKLSVVVPMYNARNIVENLKDIVKSLKKFIDDFEIIVVNDGSSNNCYNDAKKFNLLENVLNRNNVTIDSKT